jgi:cell division protein FtsB
MPRVNTNIKRVIFIGFVIVSITIIQGLLVSTYDLWKKQDLIKSENLTLEQNKQENKELKAKLREVQTREFIENEARNKLFLSKPGEKEIILPSATPTPKKEVIYIPNWKKWLDFFIPNSKPL